jgi:AhpD family alkylhydroperoxidase
MFTIHTEESAPERSREALSAIRQRIGFIPNLAATIAGSPVALAGFGALQGALRGTTLSALEREVVGVTVSVANAAPYSIAAHTAFAVGAGASDEVVAALRAGLPLEDERLEAVRRFTAALLRGRGRDVEAHGLSAEEQLEVVAVVAYTTFANLGANLADVAVDDAFSATLEPSG